MNLTLLNFNSLKRSLWRYPDLYTKLRKFKKALTHSSIQAGIEQRPEFSQLNQILSNSKGQHLINTNGKGPRVLCFSLRGAWTTHIAWETLIALGLRLRGAQVEFFTCGGALPACGMEQIGKPPCISCYHYLLNFVQPFGFPIKVANGMISKNKLQKVFQNIEATNWQNVYNYEYNGLNLGQIVLPMVRWYSRRGRLPEDKETLKVYQMFLKSSVLITKLCQTLLSKNNYDVIFCINGEFFAEAIIHLLAKKRGIRVVTYERGYHPDSLFFQHDNSACKYVVQRYWEQFASVHLSIEESSRLDNYISKRYCGVKGIGGLIFWPKIEQDEVAIRNALGLDTERPIAVLFTNTTFDTMSQNMEVAFRDMFHWIKTTIDYFNIHPEWQLVIRVHPSEVRDVGRESNDSVAEWIEATFPSLPGNIKIVRPESELSSYSLMRMSRVGFVYTSLAGLEMALMDKPVIVAGKAHYRGKGFTDDPMSPENYLKILENSLLTERTLGLEQSELARRYAYLFFFRAMIPFHFLREPTRSEVELNFSSLTELMPGRNKALDIICNGILDGKDFLL